MAKECPQCHMAPCMGGKGSGSCVGGSAKTEAAPSGQSQRQSRVKINGKDATRVLDGVSKEAADAWAERMGDTAKPGSKKRHYESKPDPEHPGKVILYFVED